MGNLHDGHLALVRQAKPLGDVTVGQHLRQPAAVPAARGLRHLPAHLGQRLREAARGRLRRAVRARRSGALPRAADLQGASDPALADILEGHFRPGFFVGVCTVVMKLFACVQPRVAVFGKKDYQQLMVIRHMVRQFALPIEIVGGETRRADDGLALSSRNGYLSEAERAEAVQLSKALQAMAEALRSGERDLAAIEARAMQSLASARLAARLPGAAPPRRPAGAGARRAAGRAGRGAAGRHAADRQPRDRALSLRLRPRRCRPPGCRPAGRSSAPP